MKPTIYTCCQAIPKDIYDCDTDRITKQVEKNLKQKMVDAIMTALESGEQVVTLHPVTIAGNERYYEVVMRQYIHMTPLIRCKDCKHHHSYECMDGMQSEVCDIGQTFYDANVDYCSLAERRTSDVSD